MKKVLIYCLLLTLNITDMTAQSDSTCPCCTDDHAGFDFWVGDWTVYDADGKIIGHNTIAKLEDGCLITEHWRGVSGTTGRSFNYYDKTDSTWNQLWVDNTGWNLKLKGKAGANSMKLQSSLQKDQQNTWYKNQVIWTLQDDGSVAQQWDIVDSEDNLLRSIFYGVYRKNTIEKE